MQRKPTAAERPRASGSETSSYGQRQGTANEEPHASQPKMPHERDESAQSVGSRQIPVRPPSDGQISHAQKDIAQGRVDTDRRGTPSDIPSKRK